MGDLTAVEVDLGSGLLNQKVSPAGLGLLDSPASCRLTSLLRYRNPGRLLLQRLQLAFDRLEPGVHAVERLTLGVTARTLIRGALPDQVQVGPEAARVDVTDAGDDVAVPVDPPTVLWHRPCRVGPARLAERVIGEGELAVLAAVSPVDVEDRVEAAVVDVHPDRPDRLDLLGQGRIIRNEVDLPLDVHRELLRDEVVDHVVEDPGVRGQVAVPVTLGQPELRLLLTGGVEPLATGGGVIPVDVEPDTVVEHHLVRGRHVELAAFLVDGHQVRLEAGDPAVLGRLLMALHHRVADLVLAAGDGNRAAVIGVGLGPVTVVDDRRLDRCSGIPGLAAGFGVRGTKGSQQDEEGERGHGQQAGDGQQGPPAAEALNSFVNHLIILLAFAGEPNRTAASAATATDRLPLIARLTLTGILTLISRVAPAASSRAVAGRITDWPMVIFKEPLDATSGLETVTRRMPLAATAPSRWAGIARSIEGRSAGVPESVTWSSPVIVAGWTEQKKG